MDCRTDQVEEPFLYCDKHTLNVKMRGSPDNFWSPVKPLPSNPDKSGCTFPTCLAQARDLHYVHSEDI